MSTLSCILDHLGFAPRPEQERLYQELRRATPDSVIVQAGTGTGKSLAVLAAAVDWAVYTRKAVAVATPTKILMDQYLTKDVPAVAAATDRKIVSLKGRKNYLCTSSRGYREDNPEDKFWTVRINEPDPVEVQNPRLGCPGRHRKKEEYICHAKKARERAFEADVVITNMHVLGLSQYFPLLPELGALFVDEAHRIEEVLRDFYEFSISRSGLRRIKNEDAEPLLKLLEKWQTDQQAFRIKPDVELVQALRQIASSTYLVEPDDEDDIVKGPINTAQRILYNGHEGAYAENRDVLHFAPGDPKAKEPNMRLLSTAINLAGPARALLTSMPSGLVSATIPRSLSSTLGLTGARYIDVGHPFDYARQATISFSTKSGAFRATRDDPENFQHRCDELLSAIRSHSPDGGVLLLFSAFRDLRAVYDALFGKLVRDGWTILKQDSDSDNPWLMRKFKEGGKVILFGSETFAAGLDVPGDRLNLVCIWKLPYPSLDPVTEAIKDAWYQRYKDMMLVKVVQGAGRLIRTTTDTGHVFIADSRALREIHGSNDPMVRHMNQFRLIR